MVVYQLAADFRAMRDAARRAVVAGRENAVPARQHAADGSSRAGRARADGLRDLHEVLIPAGAPEQRWGPPKEKVSPRPRAPSRSIRSRRSISPKASQMIRATSRHSST